MNVISSAGRKVLGVDTSLRSTGVGVVEERGSILRAVRYGVIKNPASRPHTQCLAHIFSSLREIILEDSPVAAAVEGVFMSRNARTSMILGQARGVVLAACALEKIPVFEYAPRRIKQAVVGYGGAHKDQVGQMMMRLLGLAEQPAEDASDALAMAVCHLHQLSSPDHMRAEQI